MNEEKALVALLLAAFVFGAVRGWIEDHSFTGMLLSAVMWPVTAALTVAIGVLVVSGVKFLLA